MSISPAQMVLQVGRVESPVVSRRSTPAAVPAVALAGESSDESSAPAPADSSLAPLSTDMRIDDQHHIYSEVVNDRTGAEVLEIPPEVIRKLAESFNVLLVGGSSDHRVDVKS